MSNNNKKILAEKIKKILNSPEYLEMPDLIRMDDYCPDLLTWFSDNKWGWISGFDINPNGKKSLDILFRNELEPDDWQEIVNLIEELNKKKRQIYEEKVRNIKNKLSQQKNLYYHWGHRVNEKGDFGYLPWKGMRKYLQLQQKEIFGDLFIAENHPVLNNFSFQTGFYLVDNNKKDTEITPNGNRAKHIEVGDKITITPYNIRSDNTNDELPTKPHRELENKRKESCDHCQKKLKLKNGGSDDFYVMKRYHGQVGEMPVIWACSDCYPKHQKEYFENYAAIYHNFLSENKDNDFELIKAEWADCYAGKKDKNGKVLKQENCSHCQPWKNHKNSDHNKSDHDKNKDKKELDSNLIKSLLNYFQENQIKEITFQNGELIITHNNNVNIGKVNNLELQQGMNYFCQIKQQNKITQQDLENLLNSNQVPTKNSSPDTSNILGTSLLIGGILLVGMTIWFVTKKKTTKR